MSLGDNYLGDLYLGEDDEAGQQDVVVVISDSDQESAIDQGPPSPLDVEIVSARQSYRA